MYVIPKHFFLVFLLVSSFNQPTSSCYESKMRTEVIIIIIITIIIMGITIKIMITIIMIIITWNISHPKNLKLNLHVRPPLVSDHLP